MPNIQIKDVPEAWAENLRRRASRNHRSLQGELMAIIEQAVLLDGATNSATGHTRAFGTGSVLGHDRLGHPIARRGTKTIEQIAAEHLLRFPRPIMGGPLAVDIIREDRDAR
jgi:plasmid stability protein